MGGSEADRGHPCFFRFRRGTLRRGGSASAEKIRVPSWRFVVKIAAMTAFRYLAIGSSDSARRRVRHRGWCVMLVGDGNRTISVQGRTVAIGGCERPDEALVEAAMRPSAVLNGVLG